MRWIYFGTGTLSSRFLEKLIERRLKPTFVVTGVSKRAGRGRKITRTPVFIVAHNKGIPVIETSSLDDPVILKKLKRESPSFFVVFDFGQIIPNELLQVPKIAPINVHPSLLPKYRGAAPIIRAMMNGENITGISIIKMNNKIDAGDILLQEKINIPEDITRGELEEIIIEKSCTLLEETFKGLKDGTIIPKPQKGKPSYAKKLSKDELWIDWNEDAEKIKNKIHALSPAPGARSNFKGKIIQFLRARIATGTDIKLEAGKILSKKGRLFVGTKSMPLEIITLKPAGKREMTATQFINGYRPEGLYFTSR